MFYKKSSLETLASYLVTFVADVWPLGAVMLYVRFVQLCGAQRTNAAEVRT